MLGSTLILNDQYCVTDEEIIFIRGPKAKVPNVFMLIKHKRFENVYILITFQLNSILCLGTSAI